MPSRREQARETRPVGAYVHRKNAESADADSA
jgi:hypothetical protein